MRLTACLLWGFSLWILSGMGGCDVPQDTATLTQLYRKPLLLPAFAEPPDPASSLSLGLQALTEEDFSGGRDHLMKVDPADPHYWQGRYLLGASLLWLEDYSTATQVLQEAKENLSGSWREAAQWYLGLSLLAQDLPDVACTWLDPDGYQRWQEMKGRIQELHERVCE